MTLGRGDVHAERASLGDVGAFAALIANIFKSSYLLSEAFALSRFFMLPSRTDDASGNIV